MYNRNTGSILAEPQPCIVYYNKEPYMTFKSREACAAHFGILPSAVSNAIGRRGNIVVKDNGNRFKYPVRNWNPNKG